MRHLTLHLSLLDKVGQDMRLQMVHIYHRYLEPFRQSLGKGGAHQEAPQQTRATGVGDQIEIFRLELCPPKRLTHHRHHIPKVGTARQFGHHTPIRLMHLLARNHIAQ